MNERIDKIRPRWILSYLMLVHESKCDKLWIFKQDDARVNEWSLYCIAQTEPECHEVLGDVMHNDYTPEALYYRLRHYSDKGVTVGIDCDSYEMDYDNMDLIFVIQHKHDEIGGAEIFEIIRGDHND